MTKDERKIVQDADKQRRIDNAKQYLNGGSNPYQHMTSEEQAKYQEERAKGMKAFRYKESKEDEDVDIDSIVTGGEEKQSDSDIVSGSSQADEINANIKNNISWLEQLERDAEQLRVTEGLE